MKKLAFVLLVPFSLLSSGNVFAQYDGGDKLLNAGVGLNTRYSGGLPITSSFEYGITNNISAGVGLEFITNTYRTSGPNYGYTVFSFGARVSYHINKLLKLEMEKLDLYIGGGVGYRVFNWNDKKGTYYPIGNAYGSNIFLGAHAGARYYLMPTVGAFVEVGVNGAVVASTGVAFRF